MKTLALAAFLQAATQKPVATLPPDLRAEFWRAHALVLSDQLKLSEDQAKRAEVIHKLEKECESRGQKLAADSVGDPTCTDKPESK